MDKTEQCYKKLHKTLDAIGTLGAYVDNMNPEMWWKKEFDQRLCQIEEQISIKLDELLETEEYN
jgi:hypothetical protein|tara:strand:+ start:61 stop:252 length:192 start_codon:yes stop_codon:yes gene_type:complete